MRVLSQLAAGASAVDLRRLFLFTDNQPAIINEGVRPLDAPTAASSPANPMPLTRYGRLAERLAHNRP